VSADAAARSPSRRPASARTRALYPFAWHTPVLVAPGLDDSGPMHWQTLWLRRHPEMTRIVQKDFARPDLARWAGAVAREVEAARVPPLVVAHSFGCLATVRAVLAYDVTLAGALLVAPADPDRFGIAHDLLAGSLPFPSTLVASTNDPWLKLVKAGALAAEWGCRMVSAGRAGHINSDSGHGPWPAGLGLLRDLAERTAAADAARAAGASRSTRFGEAARRR
jgi:predicted alpha/beta hydrolase family esterase